MKKRVLITAIAIAAVHAVLTIGSVMVAFGSSMANFDNPGVQPSVIGQAADAAANILMQPGKSLWTPWMSQHLPDGLEWGLFLGNSLLWGLGLGLLLKAKNLRRESNSHSNPVTAS